MSIFDDSYDSDDDYEDTGAHPSDFVRDGDWRPLFTDDACHVHLAEVCYPDRTWRRLHTEYTQVWLVRTDNETEGFETEAEAMVFVDLYRVRCLDEYFEDLKSMECSP